MADMKTEVVNEELRYLEHFGLRFNPFPVAPDLENFFISKKIDRLITEIVHGVLTRKGFMILAGEIGLGKTTISRKIMNILGKKGVETSLVFHTVFQDVELLREINRDFGLEAESLNLSDQVKILNDFLLAQNRMGKNCAIIIDDAQNLDFESLELVRMISNLETDQQKLVQILLIGQPELVAKLASPELRQLKSRIIIQVEAEPLNIEELNNYLIFKLNAAGNKGKTTVKKTAVKKIHKLSKGNFRQVNILMDRCLYVAFFHNTREISKGIVEEAHIDLGPGKSALWKRPLVRVSLVLLIFCFVGGLLHWGLDIDITQVRPARHFYPIPQANTEQAKERLPSGLGQSSGPQALQAYYRAKVPGPQRAKKEAPIPSPVVDFLREYGISEYEKSFFEALKAHRMEAVSERIFKDTGLRLILLETIPDHVREKYGILAYPIDSSGNEGYFLFWRPKLRVSKYYYGYRGEEIRILEEILAAGHFYNDSLDGVVGKNLMKAVVHFQRQMALPVTGLPDERTLFLLYNSGGQSQP
jgi:general secretion pathway protein A